MRDYYLAGNDRNTVALMCDGVVVESWRSVTVDEVSRVMAEHGRRMASTRQCGRCGASFIATQPWHRHCGRSCQVSAWRERNVGVRRVR